jgi:type II protein arginine methyltransferase
VVTEIFDAALFGEHVLTTIQSALKNLLDPNRGMVIPNKATVFGILLESQELRDSFTLSHNKFGNVVVSDDIMISIDNNEVKYTTINLSKVEHKKYLSERFEIIRINFNDIHQIDKLLKNDFDVKCSVKCSTNGSLDAIGIWFELNLFEDINISTEPPSELIGWEQAIYPTTAKRVNVHKETEVCLTFTFNEDYLKLSKLWFSGNITNAQTNHNYSLEVIKYLNSYNFHDSFIKAIDQQFNYKKILNIIDLSYFPVSSLHSVNYQSLDKVIIVTDDFEVKENINSFIKDTKTKTNKIKIQSFQRFMETKQTIEKALVLIDLIESSGLMRSNILEKLAYLKIYVLKSPIFIPFKISVKGLLIQSEDLIIRSRLISDENVHGYKIKEFLNIFEVNIKQF